MATEFTGDPARSMALLWRPPATSAVRRGPRSSLGVGRIVAAAVRLADADGLASLALRRVAGELRTAHPLLSGELDIVQREVQLGRSTGEALRQFADRCDLEEARSLSSVILQAERFGASLVKSLRVHAEMLRTKRMQYAEEMAQKAATKILFPTILFIFPGLFVIILGPAAIQLNRTLEDRIGQCARIRDIGRRQGRKKVLQVDILAIARACPLNAIGKGDQKCLCRYLDL